MESKKSKENKKIKKEESESGYSSSDSYTIGHGDTESSILETTINKTWETSSTYSPPTNNTRTSQILSYESSISSFLEKEDVNTLNIRKNQNPAPTLEIVIPDNTKKTKGEQKTGIFLPEGKLDYNEINKRLEKSNIDIKTGETKVQQGLNKQISDPKIIVQSSKKIELGQIKSGSLDVLKSLSTSSNYEIAKETLETIIGSGKTNQFLNSNIKKNEGRPFSFSEEDESEEVDTEINLLKSLKEKYKGNSLFSGYLSRIEEEEEDGKQLIGFFNFIEKDIRDYKNSKNKFTKKDFKALFGLEKDIITVYIAEQVFDTKKDAVQQLIQNDFDINKLAREDLINYRKTWFDKCPKDFLRSNDTIISKFTRIGVSDADEDGNVWTKFRFGNKGETIEIKNFTNVTLFEIREIGFDKFSKLHTDDVSGEIRNATLFDKSNNRTSCSSMIASCW